MLHAFLTAGLLTFGGLQGADLATTRAALTISPQLKEGNPIMRAPMGVQIGLKAGVTTWMTYSSRKHPKFITVSVWALNGLYIGVVAHNLKAIQKVGRQ